jgi:Pro-kumamolisin, activation domain/Subtilase family
MRLFPKRVLVALAAFGLLATASAGNAATVVSMRALSGTQLPLVRQSARLAATVDSTPVSVVLSLRPRNRALLTRAASSGRRMSDAKLRQTFAPSPGNVVAITHYMQSRGFRLTSSGLLTLSFAGDAGSARRAFGVGLSTYRAPSGKVFRAPDGAVKLPAGLAPLVEDVSGLDTALRLQRHVTLSPTPHVVGPPCSDALNGGPGYQPDGLAQAYNHDALLAAGGDGSGEKVGLVEFTNYRASDIGTYETCYGLSNTVTPVTINGGPGSLYAAIEAELDIEVAISNAPGLDEVRVYEANNNVAQILPMLEQMRNDQVTVISDSWGLCEPFLPPSFLEAESTQLQMVAAAGISFFSATGDSGSSDCAAATGGAVKALYTDDPSSQPFATAVGGTTLTNTSGASTTWVDRTADHRGGGGGGVSLLWPQPAYQTANITPDPSLDDGTKCGNFGGFCRETPDVALDANPNTGYIIYCTVAASRCVTPQFLNPWFTVGGTSGSAPLMAAIAADANTYSLQHGGGRMGFANPFLYDRYDSTPNTGTFTDVTVGKNNIYLSIDDYAADPGYDLATGLGSPSAMNLANALAAYTPPAFVPPDASIVSISAPGQAKTIVYGKAVTFRGTLLDSTDAPIPSRRVYIELKMGGFLYVYQTTTDVNGLWSIKLAKALRRNLTWSVNFPGSDTQTPAKAPGHAIHVIPHLSAAVSATSVHRGTAFTFHGTSTPNMRGVRLQLQFRRSIRASWKTLKLIAVAKNGSYTARITVNAAGPAFLRWRYAGGISKPWMPAFSPVRRVNIL